MKSVSSISVAIISLIATSVVLQPARDVSALKKETIEVYDCGPGLTPLGEGENMVCIPDPVPGGGGGGGSPPTGPDGGGAGGDGGGGDRGPSPMQREQMRKQRCKACKAANDKCIEQAIDASDVCRENARTMAESRCHFTGGNEGNTATAWGCSIAHMAAGTCPEPVGPPWNDPSQWDYSCAGGSGVNGGRCTGPGIGSCMDTWQLGYPSGTKSTQTSGTVSATYDGVGGEAGVTTTISYTTDGRLGWGAVCSRVGARLSQGCTAAHIECRQENSCSDEELQ